MKNILILSASPRKNVNSDILCHQKGEVTSTKAMDEAYQAGVNA